MTNLDSILKSRPLSTKVRLVKAMVFPVVMYLDVRAGLYRKPSAKELMLLNCGVLEKTLESPLDCKEIQSVHPKGNQS